MSSTPHLAEITRIDNDQPKPSRDGIWRWLDELRKRKVCRTAVSYVLVMWLNLQIGDVIFPMIGLPDWSLSLIIIIGVMGFPVVLILAWAFQVTPQGIVLDGGAESESRTDRKLDTCVNLLLLFSSIILSVLLLLQFLSEDRTLLLALAPTDEPTGIVISTLSFHPATEGAADQAVASGIQEELRHRLINLKDVDVLPDSSSLASDDDRRRLSLAGSVLVVDDTGHVLAHLIDISGGRYLMSVAFDIRVDTPLEAEAEAADRIVNEIRRKLLGDQTAMASEKIPRG